jgi:DNA polymerase-3 subunit gamma/tau
VALPPKETSAGPINSTEPPKENSKTKTTLNLGNIFKTNPIKETSEEKPKETALNRSFTNDELLEAWRLFTETRKNQVAEFHLLSRGYELKQNKLIIELANPVEEPLLAGFRTDLTTFLREKVGNNTITVVGQLREIIIQKMAYTNKEKFEAMAEKNPVLLQLKEKFGLDPDF